MEKHKCKLCFRKFTNGRALGGHVRSHKMNLYPPQNPKFLQEHESEDEKEEEEESNDSWYSSTSFASSSSSSSSSEDEQEDQDLKKNSFMMDHKFKNGVGANGSVVLQTKRIRSSRISGTTNQFTKFKKDTIFMLPNCEKEENSPLMESEEEDVAYCLMLLSRDKWEKTVCLKDQESKKGEEDSGVGAKMSRCKSSRGKYICETCDKVFKSYQALGGHRASHKKIKLSNLCLIKEENTNVVKIKKKLHECPICFKVFSSGQALGGHKRSHNTISSLNLSSSCSYGTNKVFSRSNGEKALIDLNLPPPIDDEDDYSQVEEFSFVSYDVDFVNPIKL